MRLCVLLLVGVLVAGPGGGGVQAKVFGKCELARLLESKHHMSKEDVKSWVCIAEHESTFNTEAVNKFNWDGSFDYGLFQLNNKYWCDGHTGKNVCNMACSSLLDDDLTDDLKCIRRIIKDTERWKGKGTGLTAWVAYVNRCQNQNLDEYIAECYDGSHPAKPTEWQPIDNQIPRVPEVSSPAVGASRPHPSNNEVDTAIRPGPGAVGQQEDPSVGEQEDPSVGQQEDPSVGQQEDPSVGQQEDPSSPTTADDEQNIRASKVPYPSHHEVRVSGAGTSGMGSSAVHVSSSVLAQVTGLPFGRRQPTTYSVPATRSQHTVGFVAAPPMVVPLVTVLGAQLVPTPAVAVGGGVSFRKARPAPAVAVGGGFKLKQTKQGSSPLGPSLTVYDKV